MSKSRGNIVRTETILDVLGADALRYFLLREVVFGQDGSFSFDALVQRYNSDLANGLGNLASRTLTMINRYFKGEVPYPSHTASKIPADDAIAETALKTIREFGTLFDQFQFSRALETAWGLVAAVDKYIVENEPWSLGEKQDDESRARLATVLYTSAEALRIATALAHPVMPDATAKIWEQMGLGDIKKLALADLAWGQLRLGTKLGDVRPVFPRADKGAIERMQQMEDQQRGPAVEESKEPPAQPPVAQAPAKAQPAATPAAPTAVDGGKTTIDDFAKIELRVGVVKVAERVPKADKLLRLEIDIGTEVRQVLAGIAEAYAPEGQRYTPHDKDMLLFYREEQDGQILEEGITEAGSMASFTAAGQAYSTYQVPMIPFYMYYSMFGFQRIGDMVWAAADARCKGFLMGGTAGRTTMLGEGLQHQDGHSHVLASTVPTCISYDPAYVYELAVVLQDGMKRMYENGEDCFYYITMYNEDYAMPAMPEGAAEGIRRGIYKFRAGTVKGATGEATLQLFGSGPILNEVLRAQEILAEKYQIAADVWSVTSYTELRREAIATERWNRLHPAEAERKTYIETALAGAKGPIIAASDYMKALPDVLAPWLRADGKCRLVTLGTDRFGRSDNREHPRRHFEVNAESIRS